MVVQRFVFLLLIGVVVTLTPAALASPPDPTWIPGLYDNADYDDAVLAVMASVASCEQWTRTAPHVERVVLGDVSPVDDNLVRTLPPAARRTRAPPTS